MCSLNDRNVSSPMSATERPTLTKPSPASQINRRSPRGQKPSPSGVDSSPRRSPRIEHGILELKQSLDKCTNTETTRMLDILRALDTKPMSMQVLQNTKVGQAVARVRKSVSDEVNSLAKHLIKKWRACTSVTSASGASRGGGNGSRAGAGSDSPPNRAGAGAGAGAGARSCGIKREHPTRQFVCEQFSGQHL
jgi:hypothetical protein